MPTNWMASKNKIFSVNSKGQKSHIEVLARTTLPLEALEDSLFLASSSFWGLLAFLGWWLHFSLLHVHMAISSVSVCKLLLPLL